MIAKLARKLLTQSVKTIRLLPAYRFGKITEGDLDNNIDGIEEEEFTETIEKSKTMVHAKLGGSVDFRNFSKLLNPSNIEDIQNYIENSGSIAREILSLVLRLTIHMMRRASKSQLETFKNSSEIKRIFNEFCDIISENGNDVELADFYVFMSQYRSS